MLTFVSHKSAESFPETLELSKLKNDAPKVSQPVFLWELEIPVYLNKYCLSSSPAEPTLLLCLWQEGRQGQSWDMMLLRSSLHTPLSGPGFTAPLPPSSLFFKNQLVVSDFSLWFCWGVNAPRGRALVIFQTKLLNNGKDCVYNWEALECPMGARLSRSRNSRKLRQYRRAPNRHHDTALGLLPPLKCGIVDPN